MAKKPTTVKKVVKKEPAKKANAAAKTPAKKATKPAAPKKAVNKTVAPKPAAKKAVPAKKAPEKKVVAAKPAGKNGAPVNHETKKAVSLKKKPVSVAPVPEAPKPKRPATQVRYSKAELDYFKQIILARQSEIMEQLQNLRDQVLDPTTGEYINENSPYSLHMAEQGTDAMEREKIYLYAQRENKFLGYLEDALKRIDAGTYGLCIECIDDPKFLCDTCPLIPKTRLEAVPHSQLCVEIKNRQEKHKKT
jgi:RNA polymerase-binding transcription factor DksA